MDLTPIVSQFWQQVLRAPPSSATADFYEEGGDSLALMTLLALIEARFGLRVPVDAVVAGVTLQSLVRLISDPDPTQHHARPEPDRSKTVIMLPGSGGDEPALARLRAACAPSLQFLTLDYGNWTTLHSPDFRFEDVIGRLMAEVLAQAPRGPVCLVGYSIGGVIAWTLAARLEQIGREVGAVIMLDSPSLSGPIDIYGSFNPTSVLNRFLLGGWVLKREWQQRRTARRDDRHLVMVAQGVARWLIAPRGARLLRLLARHPRLMPAMMAARLGNELTFWLMIRHIEIWRLGLGKLPILQAPTALLRARLNKTPEWDLGWLPLCARLDIRPVDGDHRTMLSASSTRDLSLHILDVTASGVLKPSSLSL